jgi:hypothetical protein
MQPTTTHLGRAFFRLTEVGLGLSQRHSVFIISYFHFKLTSTPLNQAQLTYQMAEVLGIVASGISVAQIAGQLLGCIQQLRTLCRALRDTPGELREILDELEILGEVFYSLGALETDSSQPGHAALRASLTHCRTAASKLQVVVTRSSRALHGERIKPWHLMKAVLKREDIKDMKGQLEATKSSLHLAMTCYSL